MTTDNAGLETALVVMAICMVIQTLMFIGVAIGVYIAYRRAGEALAEVKLSAEAHIDELRGQVQRIAATVDDTDTVTIGSPEPLRRISLTASRFSAVSTA